MNKKALGIGFLGLLGLIVSCESETFETSITDETATVDDDTSLEVAFPDRTGAIQTITFMGQEVEVEVIDGEFVSGDMILTPDSDATKSAGRVDRLWSDNTVYYSIAGNLPKKNRVTDAIKHWEQNTNLRFVQRTNQTAFIEFRKGSGCSSQVGRTGGKQSINLADGCSTGSTIHEIGHAVGLFHEQSRGDRDKFVTVNFGNIQSGKSHNFQTWKQRGLNGRDLTSTLDFGSIMMYSSKAFSKNGQPTIIKKDGSGYRTQRGKLSNADKEGIAKLYPGRGVTNVSNGTYNIIAKHSGQYMEVANSEKKNGSNVRQWTRNNRDNQQWIVTGVGNGYISIRAKHSGLYLDIQNASGTAGANLQTWGTSSDGKKHREFKLINQGNGYFSIQARHSGLCLDVFNASSAKGTNIQQWGCGTNGNKLFKFVRQ